MNTKTSAFSKIKKSLTLQILVAVILGILLGVVFENSQIKFLTHLGKLIIHWVKLIAGPFLFLTILAAIMEVKVELQHGLRLVFVAGINTIIAIIFGIGLAKFFLKDLEIPSQIISATGAKSVDLTIGFESWIRNMMPSSLFSPIIQNEILLMAIVALALGIAIRSVFQHEQAAKLAKIIAFVEDVKKIPATFLRWLIAIIPFAVFFVIAGTVSENGVGIFAHLIKYVGIVFVGFVLQIVIVYGYWIFVFARIKPETFFKESKEALFYAFGVNSSLATLPLTLGTLKKLGVSSRSASLGAGVATNLNNDGIVLYEALAVFFIMQLNHLAVSEAQMVIIALTCIVASMGITGIPEAGFISLSVVISTLGLPAEMLPLLLAVDWIIARGRSVVNVLSDLTLSIAIDSIEAKKMVSTS